MTAVNFFETVVSMYQTTGVSFQETLIFIAIATRTCSVSKKISSDWLNLRSEGPYMQFGYTPQTRQRRCLCSWRRHRAAARPSWGNPTVEDRFNRLRVSVKCWCIVLLQECHLAEKYPIWACILGTVTKEDRREGSDSPPLPPAVCRCWAVQNITTCWRVNGGTYMARCLRTG
jgi:hypothetical protein